MNYQHHISSQEGFKARLQHLAGFAGVSHWSLGLQKTVSHEIAEKPKAQAKKSGLGELVKKGKLNLSKLSNWIAEEKQYRANIRELRSLNDHVLRDIGLHRGDIAALASRFHTVEQLNEEREMLTRPVCQVVPFPSKVRSEKPARQRQAIDNAA